MAAAAFPGGADAKRAPPDALDQTVAFLARRDGIDKAVKLARYAARLASAAAPGPPGAAAALDAVDATLGTARKVYRSGKFLQHVNALRRAPRAQHHPSLAALEALATLGDGFYYGIDQFQWFVRAGVLSKPLGARLGRASAVAELCGYAASAALGVLRLRNILECELALLAELARRRALRSSVGAAGGAAGAADAAAEADRDRPLIAEIRELRARRLLRTLQLAQDLFDALLAAADLRGGPAAGARGQRAALAAAGLASGALGAYKVWRSV
jgi:hypothetical protein